MKNQNFLSQPDGGSRPSRRRGRGPLVLFPRDKWTYLPVTGAVMCNFLLATLMLMLPRADLSTRPYLHTLIQSMAPLPWLPKILTRINCPSMTSHASVLHR